MHQKTESRSAEHHIPALDGLRGVAVLMVIAFHCSTKLPSSAGTYLVLRVLDLGWSGVDLFFVLSGFLITGILLDTRDSPSYFRTFYARRALRIFPLYFAYIAVVLLFVRPGPNPWWYLSYLSNWHFARGGHDLYVGHLWSLAIEEQFYFVWPAVVWLTPRRKLAWVCLALFCAAPICRSILGMESFAAYRLTPCRMDGLALGAFVAVGMREFRTALDRWKGPALAVSLIGVLAVVSQLQSGFWNDAKMWTVGASLIVLVYACAVFTAATTPRGIFRRILSTRLLRTCGKYSYAMYVLQLVVLIHLEPFRERLPGPGSPFLLPAYAFYFAAVIGITFSGAWLSWRVLEQPFHRLKKRFSYRDPLPRQSESGAPLAQAAATS